MAPLLEIRSHIISILPNVLTMLVILITGIATGLILRTVLLRLLRYIRFNEAAYNFGFSAALFKANFQQTPSMLVSNIVYGVVLVITLLMGLTAINVSVTTTVITRVFGWIPNVMISVIILITGYLLSKFTGRSVLLTAVNAEVRSARAISFAVQLLIMVFTVAVSLEQLGIAKNTIIVAFSILFGGVVLALSIAFGLGGRDLAHDFLERRVKRPDAYSERHPFSHL
jgi:hypothetical protein